jgi:hypothetical protein
MCSFVLQVRFRGDKRIKFLKNLRNVLKLNLLDYGQWQRRVVLPTEQIFLRNFPWEVARQIVKLADFCSWWILLRFIRPSQLAHKLSMLAWLEPLLLKDQTLLASQFHHLAPLLVVTRVRVKYTPRVSFTLFLEEFQTKFEISAGWGIDDTNTQPLTMRQITLPAVSTADCSNSWGQTFGTDNFCKFRNFWIWSIIFKISFKRLAFGWSTRILCWWFGQSNNCNIQWPSRSNRNCN